MAKNTKRRRQIFEQVGDRKTLPLPEALALIKETGSARFDESVELAVNLGVDPRKSDQVVRGATVLPNGTGGSARVAVFAAGAAAEAAQAAGADAVGMEDLAERIKGGDLAFNVVIAAPDAMRVVGPLGQLLGPRGLMPNPKVGTVTADVAQAVENAKRGQVRFRTDKGGIIHCGIGKCSFEVHALQDNLEAVLADLRRLKPSSAKGVYIKRVTVASTMGIGLGVDLGSLAA